MIRVMTSKTARVSFAVIFLRGAEFQIIRLKKKVSLVHQGDFQASLKKLAEHQVSIGILDALTFGLV
jgi:hypothetical protein